MGNLEILYAIYVKKIKLILGGTLVKNVTMTYAQIANISTNVVDVINLYKYTLINKEWLKIKIIKMGLYVISVEILKELLIVFIVLNANLMFARIVNLISVDFNTKKKKLNEY